MLQSCTSEFVRTEILGKDCMNKQQLAAKIWESANKMRSKIEANEYKDYILGFIFYKFLSDNEVQFLKKNGGCQLNNDAISFQLPLTWNLAKSAIVRSTISRVLDTTIDFLLKRANQCLCLPLFCSRYTVCDLL